MSYLANKVFTTKSIVVHVVAVGIYQEFTNCYERCHFANLILYTEIHVYRTNFQAVLKAANSGRPELTLNTVAKGDL